MKRSEEHQEQHASYEKRRRQTKDKKKNLFVPSSSLVKIERKKQKFTKDVYHYKVKLQ